MTDVTMTDWGILHRITQDAADHFFLRLRITEVPTGTTRQALKEALERAGRTYSEGPYLWGNHSLAPQEQWPANIREDYTADAVDSLTHGDLLDEAKGEKRVTLRLPIGLHAILVKAAGEKSFNQFCIDTLSVAVGYGERLPDYLPLLAQHSDTTEEQMRERVAKAQAHAADLAERSENMAAKGRRMQAYFQAVGSLPAGAAADIGRATLTPAMVESINAAATEIGRLTPEQLEETAAKMGLTAEELRASNEAMRAAFAGGYGQVRAAMDAPADVIKASYQFLSEAFSPPEP